MLLLILVEGPSLAWILFHSFSFPQIVQITSAVDLLVGLQYPQGVSRHHSVYFFIRSLKNESR